MNYKHLFAFGLTLAAALTLAKTEARTEDLGKLGITPADCLAKRANSFNEQVSSMSVTIERKLLWGFDGTPFQYQLTNYNWDKSRAGALDKKFWNAVIDYLSIDGWSCRYVLALDKTAYEIAAYDRNREEWKKNYVDRYPKESFMVDFLEITAKPESRR